ncbi:MAG: HlyD family efflux transporter periplasmic adaptor subunit, partial [Myxococcota bacterium]
MKRAVIGLVVIGGALAAALLWFRGRQARATTDAPTSSSVLEGREVSVASRISGRVLEVLVGEGEAVDEGALIARIDCAPLEARKAETLARIAAAEASESSAAARVRNASAQRRANANQARSARARAAALRAERAGADRDAERIRTVGGFASESQRDQAGVRASALSSQVEAAERDVATLTAQGRATEASRAAASSEAQAAGHSTEALRAGLRSLELDIAECEVRAPQAGRVEVRFYETGEIIGPGAPIVRLVANDGLEATLYLGAEELAAARPGASVRLEVDAYPGEAFEGHVRSVATRAAFTPRNIQTRSDRQRLVYPVTVSVQADARLLPGMPADVWLVDAEGE